MSATLGSLINGISGLKRINARLEPVIEVLQRQPSVPFQEDAAPLSINRGDITFAGVNFSYNKTQMALYDISFYIPGGQTTAIIGLSGSGKSTIFKLLLRAFGPQSGSIQVDGCGITSVRLGSLREGVAVVH